MTGHLAVSGVETFHQYSVWFLFLELGIEPQALGMLGKHSTNELQPHPLYLFVYLRQDFSI